MLLTVSLHQFMLKPTHTLAMRLGSAMQRVRTSCGWVLFVLQANSLRSKTNEPSGIRAPWLYTR
ncbi:hypothetical protein D9M69_563520 [compost metagenome]